MSLRSAARRWLSACTRPLAARAARAYVAGDTLTDALDVADDLFDRGLGVTLGYWDAPDDTPQQVARTYLAALGALEHHEHSYLSIKTPAIGFDHDLMGQLVEQSTRGRVRLHIDALAPEQADQSQSLVDYFLDSGAEISYTLPGRWRRSLADADWVVRHGLTVRVVKGQWPDAHEPQRDSRGGFLEVIDALAGRARHVAVASHDVPLVAEAVQRLRAAGTSCELELLYGLPMRSSLKQADALGLGVHVYVPYGKGYLPYALGQLKRNPRMLWWLVRDLLSARESSLRAIEDRGLPTGV